MPAAPLEGGTGVAAMNPFWSERAQMECGSKMEFDKYMKMSGAQGLHGSQKTPDNIPWRGFTMFPVSMSTTSSAAGSRATAPILCEEAVVTAVLRKCLKDTKKGLEPQDQTRPKKG